MSSNRSKSSIFIKNTDDVIKKLTPSIKDDIQGAQVTIYNTTESIKNKKKIYGVHPYTIFIWVYDDDDFPKKLTYAFYVCPGVYENIENARRHIDPSFYAFITVDGALEPDQIGDLIIAFGGKRVKTLEELNQIKSQYNDGDSVPIEIIRDGKKVNLNLTLVAN